MRRARLSWAALLFGALMPAAAGDACALGRVDLGRTVFHAEDLRQAGVTRPAEVVLLVEGWQPATMDGLTWRGASALGTHDGRQWQVMLDGKAIALDVFATSALNRLPISMSQIDSVEVITLPRIHHGRVADTGLIHFHTIRPPAGASASGRVMAGNETGEPGPYQFTELRTPNVERIGPDYSLDVAGAGGAGFTRGTYTALSDYAFDNATAARNTAIAGGGDTSVEIEGVSLRSGLQLGRSSHDLLIGGSVLEDFYFLKPYGREIPTNTHGAFAAATGLVRINSARAFRYRAHYSRNELRHRRNTLDLDFDWRYDRVSGDVEFEHARSGRRVTAGVGIDHTRISTTYAPDGDNLTSGRVYADVGHRAGATLHNQVGVELLLGKEDVAISGMWSGAWRRRTSLVQFNAAYTERPPEYDARIWYWEERGYNFLSDNGVDVTRSEVLGVARRASADVLWRWQGRPPWRLESGGFYRLFWNQHIEHQAYQFEASDKSFLGPVDLVGGQRGDVAGVKLAVEFDRAGGLEARMAYQFQTTVGGDDAFTSTWKTIANHYLRVASRYTVNRKFGVWAQLTYWSSTEWRDYAEVEAQSGGEYRAHLPDNLLIDLGLDQWLWRERIRGNILFRNALDRHIRFHPIGASFDLSVFVQVEVMARMPRR